MELLLLEGVTRTIELPDAPPLTILSGVDLAVDAGDRISIVGRSGSGKSTLLNLLGLLDSPSSGRLVFDGQDVASLSSGQRDRLRGRDVGFIFQQFNLLEGRTALENVMTPLLYASGRQFWRRREIASAMLDRVGLSHRLTAMPHKLSGGEQQRVAIARSLVREPRVILADEPTGALDVETGGTVMQLLDEVARSSGAALVTITHDLAIAELASRHFRLDHGVLTPVSVHAAEGLIAVSGPAAGPATDAGEAS
ncbi:ABC transporter ATP-binding protein [Compostimonas suwonensis]|uniref:Putative ABC transport system ATP-binding protein n=1 Tax=Compostimonas suwonensis TaxID=1048394 RepID=A0A2M9BTT1_9MICO|nr:ABC transporter ATP-binding protein [Compostimonas suwonensis]PJJ61346.1 putative ABC transport system ATP-binding protein [Compostimonas suwonensis]